MDSVCPICNNSFDGNHLACADAYRAQCHPMKICIICGDPYPSSNNDCCFAHRTRLGDDFRQCRICSTPYGNSFANNKCCSNHRYNGLDLEKCGDCNKYKGCVCHEIPILPDSTKSILSAKDEPESKPESELESESKTKADSKSEAGYICLGCNKTRTSQCGGCGEYFSYCCNCDHLNEMGEDDCMCG